MQKNGEAYCDECHLRIAPHAPDKISVGKFDFHAPCYKKYRIRAETAQPRQTTRMLHGVP